MSKKHLLFPQKESKNVLLELVTENFLSFKSSFGF